MTNSGTGTLIVGRSGTTSSLNAPNVDVTGGTLEGFGVVNGAVNNTGGTVIGGYGSTGTLTVNGAYNQSGAGILQTDIYTGYTQQSSIVAVTGSSGNAAPGTAGSVNLSGGTLMIYAESSLALNTPYTVATFAPGSLYGEFGQVETEGAYGNLTGNSTSVNLGNGNTLDVIYNEASGLVQVEMVTTPAAASTWIGTSGSWNTASDWNSASNTTLPSSSSNVTIGSGGGGTVSLSQDETLNTLAITSGYTLSGAGDSITTAGNVSVASGASLVIDNMNVGGALTVGGSATIDGVLTSVGTITNAGTLTVAGGMINDSTIAGAGTYETSVAGWLRNVTISNGTNYIASVFNGGGTTFLEGAIDNAGTITLNGGNGFLSELALESDVTLTGGGTVLLSDNGNPAYLVGNSYTLTNAGNTIEGTGVISSGLAVINQATIDANSSAGSGALILNNTGGIANTGIVEATNGGHLDIASALTGAGRIEIGAGSEVELGVATAENATFLGVNNAKLRIDNATTVAYTGAITSFGVGDILELGNTHASGVSAAFDGTNTVLTVTLNGGGTLTYKLAGDLSADTFIVAPANGGVDSAITATNEAPPTIAGALAGQTTTSEAAVKPFASVTITDPNSGATDTLTITVGGTGGTLSGQGLSGGAGGVYTLTGPAATVTSELDALSFTPKGGQPATSSTSTFTLSDKSSLYGTATVDNTTTVIDTDPAQAPTIAGAVAGQPTTSERPVNPFASVTVTDPNAGATDTLTITVGGSGGTLTGQGLSGGTGGVYTLSGSAATVTSELDALSFTPKAGTPGTSSTSTFTLSDKSSLYGTATVNGTTTVIDTDPGWKSPVSGSWNTASNWNPAAVPASLDQANIAVAGTYTVTSSQNNKAGSLNISDAGATLSIGGNSLFTLAPGSENSNAGTIVVNEGSTLFVAGGAFSNQGVLGSTGPGTGLATIENAAIANTGTIAATGVSNLVLENTTIANAGGLIQAQGSSALYSSGYAPAIILDNATIAGGTLSTGFLPGFGSNAGDFWDFSNPVYFVDGISTGYIETSAGSQSNVLDGTASSVTNSAMLAVNSTSTLTLEGTINNQGEIGLNTASSVLQVSGAVQLSGGGVISTSQWGGGTISGAGATLTNVNDTIEANTGTLTINTGSNAISNTGTLASVGGNLIVVSAVTGTGFDQISSGTLEFGASVSSGQQVQFSGSADLLKLDHAESFGGTAAGFAASDVMDLANFKFADTTITNITGTGAQGTTTHVTLTDSADNLSATINLLNQINGQFTTNKGAYSLASDNTASPATAGTLFTVAPNILAASHPA